MFQKKNIKLGKFRFSLIIIFLLIFGTNLIAEEHQNLEGKFVELKILDKVSSKNTTVKLEIGKEKKFQNLLIKFTKCKNSQFDDNPEITAYLQVKDIAQRNNDKVFIFNGWTFSSSPTVRPFDHPVYDMWLNKCFN